MNAEALWDKKLKIHTTGRDESRADRFHYPYEPTPYPVLERMAQSGYLSRRNVLVDYGCGKGRVSLFLASRLGCRAVGVEYDPRIYEQAQRNRLSCPAGSRVEFVCAAAEGYDPEDADSAYFFNPFSSELMASVLERLEQSRRRRPRPIRLFFYYPNDDYRRLLDGEERLAPVGEIDCRDLFDGCDPREVILIYEMKG